MKEGEPISNADKHFLQMAIKVALTSTCRMRHGALVVKHGQVLATSPNIARNNPDYVAFEHCSTHAEIRAMKKAKFPRRATVYVARVNRKAEKRYSRPCEGCMSLLDELKCRAVWT